MRRKISLCHHQANHDFWEAQQNLPCSWGEGPAAGGPVPADGGPILPPSAAPLPLPPEGDGTTWGLSSGGCVGPELSMPLHLPRTQLTVTDSHLQLFTLWGGSTWELSRISSHSSFPVTALLSEIKVILWQKLPFSAPKNENTKLKICFAVLYIFQNQLTSLFSGFALVTLTSFGTKIQTSLHLSFRFTLAVTNNTV